MKKVSLVDLLWWAYKDNNMREGKNYGDYSCITLPLILDYKILEKFLMYMHWFFLI